MANSTQITCDIRRFVERDIDLLIAEELRVNPAFGAWMMSHFKLSEPLLYPASFTNVSDVEDRSEADIAASFDTVSGKAYRLFVEDKIDAVLMPAQLERYVRRGKGEIARGTAVGFSVLFLTPSNYLRAHLPDGVVQLSFEIVAAYLRSSSTDARAHYRASLLEKAVPVFGPKARDAAVAATEPYVKSWWDAVYAMLEREFPNFFFHRTRYPRSVYFAPEMFGQAKYLRVDFKGHKGEVDLAFKDIKLQILAGIMSLFSEVPGLLVVNGRSTALRISGLDTFVISEGYGIIETKVCAAYKAAFQLLSFWHANRTAFDAVLLATPATEAGRG